MLFGGESSWAAAKRDSQRHGTRDTALLFCDTLAECADTYRFAALSAANVLGLTVPPALAESLDRIPAQGDPGRPAYLLSLGKAASEALPRFHWEADGRTIWQVFRQARMMGNTRNDPCSLHLKRQVAAHWVGRHLSPRGAVVMGYHVEETHRVGPTRERYAALGFDAVAPLCEKPLMGHGQIVAWARAEGLPNQRLYQLGMAHGNCGGACVRAGHKHWKLLLEKDPDLYALWEREEQDFREYVGKDVAILRDRRGGKTTPLTLKTFRERVQAGEPGLELDGDTGCGCFTGVLPGEGGPDEP